MIFPLNFDLRALVSSHIASRTTTLHTCWRFGLCIYIYIVGCQVLEPISKFSGTNEKIVLSSSSKKRERKLNICRRVYVTYHCFSNNDKGSFGIIVAYLMGLIIPSYICRGRCSIHLEDSIEPITFDSKIY